MSRLCVVTFCYVVIAVMAYLVAGGIAVSMAQYGNCYYGDDCVFPIAESCSDSGNGGVDCSCCPNEICEAAC